MPQAPIGVLLAADLLGIVCAAAGVLAAYRRPVTSYVLVTPLFALAFLAWGGFMVALGWQAATAGLGEARPTLIVASVAFVVAWSFVCGAAAMALRTQRASVWWLEQQMARHPDRASAPPEPPLGRLLEDAPPAARLPVEAWTYAFAVCGAFGLAMPWILA